MRICAYSTYERDINVKRVEIVKRIASIKNIETLDITLPYSSIKMMSYVEQYKFRLLFCSTVQYIVAYENDIPIIILPVRIYDAGIAAIVGTVENFDCSSIYLKNDYFDQSLFNCMLQKLREKGVNRLIAKHVKENIFSQIKDFCCSQKLEWTESNRDGVKINLRFECYDLWLASLSKHTRQNIRTAYNRINKEGFDYEFNYYESDFDSSDNLFVDKTRKKEYLDLYIVRQKSKYTTNRTILSKLKKEIRMIGATNYKKANAVTKRMWYRRNFHYASNVEKNGNPFWAELKIKGSLVAFMCGYVDEGAGVLHVPRLAINDSFAMFSPGVCLINSLVRYMYENTIYRVLDLGTGDEPYKLSLGGERYLLYDLELKL